MNKQKPEIIAQKGVKVQKHPQLAGWAPGNMLCLLPHQSGSGSWLSNFVVNHFLLLLEEQSHRNKVKTLNCDVPNNMTKPCKKIFVKNKYNTLYPNVFDSDVILSLFNQSQHWTLLSVFPERKGWYSLIHYLKDPRQNQHSQAAAIFSLVPQKKKLIGQNGSS